MWDIWSEEYKVGNGQRVGELLLSARAQGGSIEEVTAEQRLGWKEARMLLPQFPQPRCQTRQLKR